MLDELGKPQPYGELFLMHSDGSDVRQLTDNQWEDGSPAWRPTPRQASPPVPPHDAISDLTRKPRK